MRLIPSNQAKIVSKVLTLAKRQKVRSQNVTINLFGVKKEDLDSYKDYLKQKEIKYKGSFLKESDCYHLVIGSYPKILEIGFFIKDE